jgi:hypothetical protein
MELLDEKGRIFGRVNIIDALVVLFALAILVAGAALVFGDTNDQPTPDEQTLYVTVTTGGQTATHLSTGEIVVDGTPANITDVHRTAGPRTYLRLELNGTETDDGFRFGEDSIRLGDRLTLTDGALQTETRVVERDTDASFETQTTAVTLIATTRTPIADAVTTGDSQHVGGTPVATVTSVDRTRLNETHSRLRVRLDLETRAVEGNPHYGGRPVRLGRRLAVETDAYEFEGEIIERE